MKLKRSQVLVETGGAAYEKRFGLLQNKFRRNFGFLRTKVTHTYLYLELRNHGDGAMPPKNN